MLPKEHLVFAGLNSYYLDIEKLVEHYRLSGTSGCIKLQGKDAEAHVFFGFNDIYSAFFLDSNGMQAGYDALQSVREFALEKNFIVNIYRSPDEMMLFWGNLPRAEDLYTNRSTDLTDLDKLAAKMTTEKITGYIEIVLEDSGWKALLFFHQGDLIGGSCPWAPDDGGDNRETLLHHVLEKLRGTGGVFHVRVVPLEHRPLAERLRQAEPRDDAENADYILALVGDMLSTAESVVGKKLGKRESFDTVLRRKFVEKAEEYPFLDPFADEFSYARGRVRFEGSASARDLAAAVHHCLLEIAEGLKVQETLERELAELSGKYAAGCVAGTSRGGKPCH
jgi:hypothetical protein